MSNSETDYEVVIIGGSYAGLAAATGLGRALRKVLVIDAGKPCNRQTPHSHNFLTRDGETPAAISLIAREQLKTYHTVTFINDTVIDAIKNEDIFEVIIGAGKTYKAKKLILATGITDVMPNIAGFAECWGISVLHCPYCHGYEVRHQPTGVLANGDAGFDYAKLISNWTDNLTLFTNGPSALTTEQTKKLRLHKINIEENEIARIEQSNGQIKSVVLKNDEIYLLNALYHRPAFIQHSNLVHQLGCDITDTGHISADYFGRTSIPGVYAAGDNCTPMRTIAMVVSQGTTAGVSINRELIDERYAD